MAAKNKPLVTLTVLSKEVLEKEKKCICYVESVEHRGVTAPKSFEVPFIHTYHYSTLPVKMYDRVVYFNEYKFYQDNELFVKGQRYDFKVVSCREGVLWDYVIKLLDKYGREQETRWHRRFPKGRTLSCKVMGLTLRNKGSMSLDLDDLKLYAQEPEEAFDEKNPPMYHGKRPEQWVGEVQGKPKHLYGASFTCSCCHRPFGSKQGYKLDFEDLVFCKYCSKVIFKKEPQKQPRVIYTPMGNKK